MPDIKEMPEIIHDLLREFPNILTEEELNQPPHLIAVGKFYTRICYLALLQMDILKIDPKALKTMMIDVRLVPDVQISASDILELTTNVRFPGMVWVMMGLNYQREAREKMTHVVSAEERRGDMRLLLPPMGSTEGIWEVPENLHECIEQWPFLKKLAKWSGPKATKKEGGTGKESEKQKERETKKEEEKKKVADPFDEWEWTPLTTDTFSPKDEEERIRRDYLREQENKRTRTARLREARRLLKRGLHCILKSQVSTYCMSPYVALLWADMLTDLADTHDNWERLDHLYEVAYEKFNISHALAGPFRVHTHPYTLSMIQQEHSR